MQKSMTQGERFAFMLSELGMTQAEFSRATGISEGTLSNWRKGNRAIRTASAKAIERVFPQFSAAWIQGTSEHLNAGDRIASEHESNYMAAHEAVRGAATLAGHVGYNVDFPAFHVRHDSLKQSLFDATNAGYRAAGATFIDVDAGNEVPSTVTITHDGKTAEVTMGEFEQFADELADFASIRLSRMVKRANSTQ